MKKLLLPLLAVLASCGQSSLPTSSPTSVLEERVIAESFIEEEVLKEEVLGEEVLGEEEVLEEVLEESSVEIDWEFYEAATVLRRQPSSEEAALAPSLTIIPGRYTFDHEALFDHMEEGSQNGLEVTEFSDPESRAYAFMIVIDGKLWLSSGIGLNVLGWASFTSVMEEALVVRNLEVFINYSVTDRNTKDIEDIVTLKVAEFQFQFGYNGN